MDAQDTLIPAAPPRFCPRCGQQRSGLEDVASSSRRALNLGRICFPPPKKGLSRLLGLVSFAVDQAGSNKPDD